MSDTAAAKPAASDVDPDTGHDYDGIREFDNRLPNWWLVTLYVTVLFGYGYWFYYHVIDRPGAVASWQAEEAAIAKATADSAPVTNELLATLSHDADTVGKGAAVYKQQCVACHSEGGEGKIGPNLTDGFWLHGSKPTDLYKTISEGVVAKGMPAWGPVLGAEKVRAVTAFVQTIQGKNLPGKAAEGEKVE